MAATSSKRSNKILAFCAKQNLSTWGTPKKARAIRLVTDLKRIQLNKEHISEYFTNS